jgi:CPA2 family monovalent cation:H+ antiporter-2
LVIATGQVQASRELTPLAQARLPDITRMIAVPGADALEEFSALGMLPVDMSMSGGAERLTDLVFAAMGRERALPVPSLAHNEPRLPVAA